MKSGNQTPSFFFKITQVSQIKKRKFFSLTDLNLSFSGLGCFNLEFDILQCKIGYELREPVWQQGALVAYTYKQHFFAVLQKRHFERRIITKHEDIHWFQRSPCRTAGPHHTGFLSFGYLDDKVWSYFEEKVGRLVFKFSQIWTRHIIIYNRFKIAVYQNAS